MSSLVSSTFKVEQVSPSESKELATVRADYESAKAKLVATETRIKEAHGQPKPTNFTNASCIGGNTTVELRGEYALISTEVYNLCDGGR